MEGPEGEAAENAHAMLQTVQQQAQELQQLRAEKTALRQVLSSRSMDIPPVSAATPRYSGDPLKIKEFLDALMVFFAFDPLQFSSDKAKVGYLISALYGPALAWATPLVFAEDPVLTNYPAFLTLFKQMFERPGVEAVAEEALCDMQQGNQDVLQYITCFKQLAAETS
ncbi:protein LDOC1-like [Pleurodeles waltl]|uniref:protein LDOC1-like n=1 Tax=Pleurodeles waltl TaxID=8319 RepID=UPI0037097626